jgi:hypothetical protein
MHKSLNYLTDATFLFLFYSMKKRVLVSLAFNYICMKRKLLYAAGFILIALSFTSCEGLKNCKICQQNTYNSGGSLLTEGSETEYCDAALVRIQATPDVTVLGITTKWVCR